MTLEWSLIAALLYTEIAVTLLLLVPWIKPRIWRKLFKSRIGYAIGFYAKQVAIIAGVLLVILFLDAVRATRKYSSMNVQMSGGAGAETDTVVHAHLFHAERNEYITGFSLLLFMVISRIVKIIHRMADCQNSSESSLRQAMEMNKTTSQQSENEQMQKEIKGELRQMLDEIDTLKAQSNNLTNDYDEILSKLKKYQLK